MAATDALIDKPKEVRDGESFDIAKMDAWLKQQVPSLAGEPTVKQFSGGASNLTYLIAYPNQEFVLRRPPFGKKAKSAHDMGRDFAQLAAAIQGPFLLGQTITITDVYAAMLADWYDPAKDLPDIAILVHAVLKNPAAAEAWRHHGFGV